MEGVLTMVRESAEQNSICRIKKINLVIGKLAMVLPDSLQFCFQALSSQEELFQGAVLEIEDRDAVARCAVCEHQFTLEDGFCFVCPSCEGINVAIISGREMYLDYYEGDDN
jgi:hydrogenase nickel incorporation protein HypA/HybF